MGEKPEEKNATQEEPLNRERLWTVQEVCEYWNVSDETVYRLIRKRAIKFKPLGRSYRIPDSQVKAGYGSANVDNVA